MSYESFMLYDIEVVSRANYAYITFKTGCY